MFFMGAVPVRRGARVAWGPMATAIGGLLAAIACSTAPAPPSPEDEAGVIPHRDASLDDALASDASREATHVACTPDRPYTPAYAWEPPSGPWPTGDCTSAQIQQFFADCGGPGKDCTAFLQDPSTAGCVACIFTVPGGSATYGPIVLIPNGQGGADGYVNFGGCIAHFDGNDGPTGCGAKDQMLNDCLSAACNDCPDFFSGGPETQACEKTARQGVCAAYWDQACVGEESTYAVCDNLSTFLGLWCGPIAADAGGGGDGGDGDGGDGAAADVAGGG
jgi:hypothetical protein